MNSTKWRDRLTFMAMSLVVGWHTLAMMIAPAPENSVLVRSLRRLFDPYLSLLRLDNPWNFFAPIGKNAQFRYVIEDAAGNEHTFVPTEELTGSISRYVWWREFKYLDDEIMEFPKSLAMPPGPYSVDNTPLWNPVQSSFRRSRSRSSRQRMNCAANIHWTPNLSSSRI